MSKHLNVEIKARCQQLDLVRQLLLLHDADYKGTDLQTDTYFPCPHGRLKLRQGNIENALIFYARENAAGPKGSTVNMMGVEKGPELRSLLADALGIKVEVVKRREIYFINNVKFHLDQVDPLGTFVEIEAIDKEGTIGEEALRQQCDQYMQLLQIQPGDLVQGSYSDMLLQAMGG
jgi:predicted adenylyl cyclase CyaB